MKRYIVLIAVVLLASFAMSGIALAAADVQRLVPYAYTGQDPDAPDASGKAVLNQPNGKVCFQVTVSAKGLEPETEYKIYIAAPGGWQPSIGTFMTNKNGNGHFHKNWSEDPPEPGNVAINTMADRTVLIDEHYQ